MIIFGNLNKTCGSWYLLLLRNKVWLCNLCGFLFCVRCSEGRGSQATDGGELMFSEPLWAEWHSLWSCHSSTSHMCFRSNPPCWQKCFRRERESGSQRTGLCVFKAAQASNHISLHVWICPSALGFTNLKIAKFCSWSTVWKHVFQNVC